MGGGAPRKSRRRDLQGVRWRSGFLDTSRVTEESYSLRTCTCLDRRIQYLRFRPRGRCLDVLTTNVSGEAEGLSPHLMSRKEVEAPQRRQVQTKIQHRQSDM